MAELKHAVFRPSNLLLWLSGADLGIIERAPHERRKFVEMGAIIAMSAMVAAISMAFALHSAVAVPVPFAIVLGLAWGLLTLNLNRFLLTSMTGVRKWRSLLLMAAPRVLMSILLTLVIATPLVLDIFAPEINGEVQVLRQHQAQAYFAEQKTSAQGQRITADEATVNKLQDTISSGGGPLPDPHKAPAAQNLTAQLNKAQANLKTDYAALQCALYGGPNCGSGNTPPLQSAKAAYQADVTQVATLKKQLTSLVQRLNEAALANQAAALQAARKELPAAQARLRQDVEAQQAQAAQFEAANNGNGILIRVNALSAVTSGDTTVAVARDLLLLLFLIVDLLPILTRLLLRLGPPSTYDMILDSDERALTDLASRRAQRRRLEADLRRTAEIRRAEHERDLSPARLTSFREQVIPHADGELRRLEIDDDEFLLIDVQDGVPTLNWTASIGAREFALLVSSRLEWIGQETPAEIMISMAGIADQLDARLGVELAVLASPAFDQQSEFIRFDDPDIALALQSLHGDDGDQVKMFGVSAAGLSLGTVLSLMERTATRRLAAHARAASASSLIARMAEVVYLPGQGDPAPRWLVEGEVEHEQAQR